MLVTHGIGGVERGEQMGQLAQGAAESVVLGVVVGRGDCVAAGDGGGAVRGVGGVGCEVDFSEELLFVVFEFADHCCLFAFV